MDENQIQLLIQFNIPDNNQQLVTPSKVREVLSAILSYATNQQIVIPDDLQVVTDRGADTTKNITVGGVRIRVGLFSGNFNVPELTGNRQWTMRDMDGTVAFLSDITGGPGGIPALQEVVEQGGEVVLDLGDDVTFFANLPFNNGIDRNASIGMLAGADPDTQISATLSVNESSAVLSASGANGVRIYEMRRNAIAVEMAEGAYNILDSIYTRPLAIEDYARVSVEIPTPKNGTTVRYLYPYSFLSGDFIMATQQWATAIFWQAVNASAVVAGIAKLYAAGGTNTDGSITQKFFTETLLAKKGIENNNYTILATDKWVHTAAALTASRTFTLPGDAPQGKEIIVADEFGAVGTFTLTVAAPSGKRLNGVLNGTEVIQAAYGWRRFVTDGNGNWFFDAGIVRQAQLTSALALKADRFLNVKVPTTAYHTGTLTETEIYRLELAPNTFSAVDILKLHRLLFQKIGAGGNFTVRVKLSTSATMPSGTTDQIAQFTGSNLSNSLSRTLSIFADSITGYAFNISFSSDSGPTTSSMSTALFNRTISQYLYISVTLANSADQVRLVGGQILNV